MKRMMAKYTFTANPDTPLGKELSLKPKEEVWACIKPWSTATRALSS
jgi:hypothetical protein